MGLRRMSDKNVAKLNRRLGTDFVKVAVQGSPTWAEGVTADDVHYEVDRRTGKVEKKEHPAHWTSCSRPEGGS